MWTQVKKKLQILHEIGGKKKKIMDPNFPANASVHFWKTFDPQILILFDKGESLA